MHQADRVLSDILQSRKQDLSIRSLEDHRGYIDFASNDYLGLSRSAWLRQQVDLAMKKQYAYVAEGATGSRLISGQNGLFKNLEDRIAAYHYAEAALLFNSGYDANLGFFAAVPQPDDLVIADELIHASVRDGMKLTRGDREFFLHNDLTDLEAKLDRKANNKFVVVESIYSMDGDLAPLKELVELCEKYDAQLVVDEAHATGIFGAKGEGRVVELGLQDKVYARVVTYGKALGSHGATVLGSAVLKEFLVNYARSFIYTTALPFSSILRLKKVYDILSKQKHRVIVLSELCALVEEELKVLPEEVTLTGDHHIKSLLVPGNDRAKAVSAALEKEGIYAKAILYPTVPKGKERIRLCIHSFNTKEEIRLLADTIKRAL